MQDCGPARARINTNTNQYNAQNIDTVKGNTAKKNKPK